MISTRSVALLIDTVVCLTLAKWETVSGRFGGYLRFQNVEGLLVNFTGYEDPQATNLGGVYYDFDSSNTFSLGPEGGCCSAVGQPIIEFVTTQNISSVPGPIAGAGLPG